MEDLAKAIEELLHMPLSSEVDWLIYIWGLRDQQRYQKVPKEWTDIHNMLSRYMFL